MPPSAGKGSKKGSFLKGKNQRLMPPSAGSRCQKRAKKGLKRGFLVKKVVLGVKTAFPMGYTPFGPIAGA